MHAFLFSCLFTAASRMPSSHVSPQVCRPHFHAPLPWLSEPPKSLASSAASAWGSPFACPQDPQDKVSQAVQSSQTSGQHLFSFPPTPPKDSTPDSVQTGATEYQAAVNAFMHQAQVTSNSALNGAGTESSCGLDIKPCLTGNSSSTGQSKQREGTTTANNNNNNNNSSSQSNNNSATNASSNNNNNSLNSSLFDAHQSYGGYDGYGYHQTGSAFQSGARSNMSPHTKPQRTKARTSAGKTFCRHGVGVLLLFSLFGYVFAAIFIVARDSDESCNLDGGSFTLLFFSSFYLIHLIDFVKTALLTRFIDHFV